MIVAKNAVSKKPDMASMDEAERFAYEAAKMVCSRENPGACEMCSG